jgi:PAS domain-containing protein
MDFQPTPPRIFTIPSDDTAFREHVDRMRHGNRAHRPEELEVRLRRLFPRVVVRERGLSGESPSWYVYRDGGWRSSMTGPWWEAPELPRVASSSDGWLTEANPAARSLLGIEASEIGSVHFTDFVAAGTPEDATALLASVEAGRDLTATVLLRPTSGEIVAIDIHAQRDELGMTSVFRLAEDVAFEPSSGSVPLPELVCQPADPAFRAYAERALARLPDPTPDLLALRLRRLYPHARVVDDDGHWTATRDAEGVSAPPDAWWLDETLPRVNYDAQALILEANAAAQGLLGSDLIGHYWQEFVTPGSTEQVSAMLSILSEVGAAESRFRMPAADGSLVEFDSYTIVDGERFTTIMRPRDGDGARGVSAAG